MSKGSEVSSKTSPLKQLNFKVQEDFYWELKNTAGKQRCKMIEILEKAWKLYQKREQEINEINVYQQNIQAIEKQMRTFQGKIDSKELELRINNLNPIYFDKIGLVITYRILRGALEECLRCWKGVIVF